MTLHCNVVTDRAPWHKLNTRSEQRSVFSSPTFLDALGVRSEFILVSSGTQVVAGAMLLLNEGGPIVGPFPFTTYQGLAFDRHVSDLPLHSKGHLSLRIVSAVATFATQRYRQFSLCIHPTFQDMRGFQWYNFHEPARGQFDIQLRYTGILMLSHTAEWQHYIHSIRINRQRELKKTLRDGLVISESDDIDELDRLHDMTFQRQGRDRSATDSALLKSIASSSLKAGVGRLLLCKTADGRNVSASMFLYDDRAAYYLFGANDPAFRNSGASTALMLDQIAYARGRGLDHVDFVGINSPARGDYKLSFNAQPCAYFVVTWEAPEITGRLRHNG